MKQYLLDIQAICRNRGPVQYSRVPAAFWVDCFHYGSTAREAVKLAAIAYGRTKEGLKALGG
jgi:hypothetical protein